MIDELLGVPFWLAIGKIAWIDVLLSGDNAVVIALAARDLPPQRQRQAVWLGSAGAIVLRVAARVLRGVAARASRTSSWSAPRCWCGSASAC